MALEFSLAKSQHFKQFNVLYLSVFNKLVALEFSLAKSQHFKQFNVLYLSVFNWIIVFTDF